MCTKFGWNCAPRRYILNNNFYAPWRYITSSSADLHTVTSSHSLFGDCFITVTRVRYVVRVLLKTLESRNYRHISSGEPTYWPTDLNKFPDLLDFCVTKGIHSNSATAKSCFELSSDHSPVLVSLSTQPSLHPPPPRLYNQRTNWEAFRDIINEHLQLHISLKTESDIEDAVKNFNDTIQWAAWNTTRLRLPHLD
jgi:hypothetical protein